MSKYENVLCLLFELDVIILCLKLVGEVLIAKKHKSSREIKLQLDHLLSLWKNLLQESSNRGRGLEEAQDILEFNNQVDKIELWIREKVRNTLLYFKRNNNLVFCYLLEFDAFSKFK